MTEKRFTISKGYRIIKDNITDECATFYDNDDGETFLKWLNELHEENEALKKFVKVNFSDMMAEKMKKELKDE